MIKVVERRKKKQKISNQKLSLLFAFFHLSLSRLTVSTNGLKCCSCAAALKCCQFCLLTWQCPLSLCCFTPFSCSFSPSLLCQATYNMAINIFAAAMGNRKKNKVERSRKTSLPHPEMLLLLSCLPCSPFLTPWPPLLTPCSASAFKLQSSSVWLTFAASTLRQLLLDFCQDKRAAA